MFIRNEYPIIGYWYPYHKGYSLLALHTQMMMMFVSILSFISYRFSSLVHKTTTPPHPHPKEKKRAFNRHYHILWKPSGCFETAHINVDSLWPREAVWIKNNYNNNNNNNDDDDDDTDNDDDDNDDDYLYDDNDDDMMMMMIYIYIYNDDDDDGGGDDDDDDDNNNNKNKSVNVNVNMNMNMN